MMTEFSFPVPWRRRTDRLEPTACHTHVRLFLPLECSYLESLGSIVRIHTMYVVGRILVTM